MFPYPSGAGLHVGHPLGYIASDIFQDIKDTKDIMFFILRDMTLLVCQKRNMQ